jgi:hypothetical protein
VVVFAIVRFSWLGFALTEKRLSQSVALVKRIDEDFSVSPLTPNRMSRLAIDPPPVLSSAAMTAAQERW